MSSTNRQVRRLMAEFAEHGRVGEAALRAGMDRTTARKYIAAGKLPSDLKQPRTWRTREDPFESDWEAIREMLEAAPELEAVTVFDHLVAQAPGQYQDGQLRTLQRRIKCWQAEEGPPREVFFTQVHRPGEAMQTDFTSGNELGVTIGGEAFPHLICHPVLPYSNWEWVTVCRSESLAALRRGVQSALFEIRRTPSFHQTDNSTAATHDLRTGLRGFNEEYLQLMEHFGMTPRTTGIGEKEQNGDVESLNGVFKRRVRQYLKLRGNAAFGSLEEYETWLQEVARRANRNRDKKVQEELERMRPLAVCRLPEFSEVPARVTEGSTIRVKSNVYSVPSRLKGETVRARVYENRVDVYYGQKLQLSVERLRGSGGCKVNYRHVIHSLVRKPGAFERYRYREELFPTGIFRKAYDRLAESLPPRRADLEYLRSLQLAADTMESDVEAALSLILETGGQPTAQAVEDIVRPGVPAIPELSIPVVDLRSYDLLLEQPLLEVAS